MPNGDPTCSGPTELLNRRRLSVRQRRSVFASRGSMQVTSRDQAEKEIFVVVGNSGCHAPAPTLACWAIHAEAPEWNPFQEPKISPAQHRFAVVATLLWPTELVAEVLALMVTDAGGDSGAALPSAIIIGISLLLNAAIYVGIGLILWPFREVFSRFFQRRSPNKLCLKLTLVNSRLASDKRTTGFVDPHLSLPRFVSTGSRRYG